MTLKYQKWDSENQEWAEATAVINAFTNINKPLPKNRWLHECGAQMYLYPQNKDLPAEYWICKHDNTKITIEQRNQTFIEVLQSVKELYNLKTLQYNRQNNRFTIVSNRWVSPDGDRIGAKRYVTKRAEDRDIENEILYLLKSHLHISIDSLQDFFNEQ